MNETMLFDRLEAIKKTEESLETEITAKGETLIETKSLTKILHL